jgi:hypothetical protein
MFDALSYKSCVENTSCIYLLLVHYINLESYLGAGTDKCLAMLRPVETG